MKPYIPLLKSSDKELEHNKVLNINDYKISNIDYFLQFKVDSIQSSSSSPNGFDEIGGDLTITSSASSVNGYK